MTRLLIWIGFEILKREIVSGLILLLKSTKLIPFKYPKLERGKEDVGSKLISDLFENLDLSVLDLLPLHHSPQQQPQNPPPNPPQNQPRNSLVAPVNLPNLLDLQNRSLNRSRRLFPLLLAQQLRPKRKLLLNSVPNRSLSHLQPRKPPPKEPHLRGRLLQNRFPNRALSRISLMNPNSRRPKLP